LKESRSACSSRHGAGVDRSTLRSGILLHSISSTKAVASAYRGGCSSDIGPGGALLSFGFRWPTVTIALRGRNVLDSTSRMPAGCRGGEPSDRADRRRRRWDGPPTLCAYFEFRLSGGFWRARCPQALHSFEPELSTGWSLSSLSLSRSRPLLSSLVGRNPRPALLPSDALGWCSRPAVERSAEPAFLIRVDGIRRHPSRARSG
jgi:hypothetical protein